jgi:hypothetical protein
MKSGRYTSSRNTVQIVHASCCEAYGDKKNTKDVQRGRCNGGFLWLPITIVHDLLKVSVSSLYRGTGRSSCRAGKNRLMLLLWW